MLIATALQYLVPWARVGQAAKEAEDVEVGKKLWTWLEERVHEFESQSAVA